MLLDNYEGTSSGLDKIALKQLYDILENKGNDINILEFGSGQSTKFIKDYAIKTNKNISVDSYDHDPKFSYKHEKNDNIINLKIKPLISCSEEHYNEQIENKTLNKEYFSLHKSLPYNHPKFWRQRNCIYDIDFDDLKPNYDIVIIDGPNGNGRCLSFLFFKDRVKKDSIIFMDDFNAKDGSFEYNYVENLKNIITVEEIFKHTNENAVPRWWEEGGNFIIFKVK